MESLRATVARQNALPNDDVLRTIGRDRTTVIAWIRIRRRRPASRTVSVDFPAIIAGLPEGDPYGTVR